MTTLPSGETRATSNPTHGPPEASLGDVADGKSPDSSTGGSQSLVPLPTVSSAAAPAGQDSFTTAPSEVASTSGDKDKEEVAPDKSQEKPREVTALLLRQDPEALKLSTSLQNPEPDRPAPDTRLTQSLVVFSGDPLGNIKTPQTDSVPHSQPEVAASAPKAQVWPTEDFQGQLDAQASRVTEVAQEGTEGPEASTPDAAALPPSQSKVVTGEDLVGGWQDLQAPSFPPSSEGSASRSPGPQEVALGRRPLDPSLYAAGEEHGYMRSMTSLLGGGEGTISSLADILVWSEGTMGMGTATGILASGHSSATDLLHGPGPSLRSVSSILESAGSAFSSGLVSGTGSALRSVTHALETVERRTVEGIRSALRYLRSRLPPRRPQAGASCD
ncbi:testis-expressed protein 44 [Tupaia chinensis]|uniref:Uncharacterized protein n=1 Tax=Tupaia chinensis TaxID=246437 RepID=L8Y3G8_TUPCH|nr:testis-expressed protein 44 [Tupaia chinensis]ELV09584.1 hypothetical protein TREES_T100019090 [Tupaia chinensis]